MIRAVLSRETEQQQVARGETVSGTVPGKAAPAMQRWTLGSLVMIVLLLGINLYTVVQLREISALSIELMSQRYPAIESAKWLLTNLYAQVTSERNYLAARDPWFLMEFRDEAEEFTQTLVALQAQESSSEGRALLGEAEQLYADYRILFRMHVKRRSGLSPGGTEQYEKKRDAVVAQIAQRLQAYVGLHETQVSGGVHDVSSRSAQAHAFAQITIAAMLLALGVVGVIGIGLLRSSGRRQAPVTEASLESAQAAADDEPPSTARAAEGVSAVLTPRTWQQIRQAVPQIWKGAS